MGEIGDLMEKEQVKYEKSKEGKKNIKLGVLDEKTGKFVPLKSKKGQRLAQQTHKLKGWRNESARHSLARKGIKTKDELISPTALAIKEIKRKRKTSRENVSPKEIIGSTIPKVKKMYGWSDDEVASFLEDQELNTCDKCGEIDSTYDLVWIDSGDFEPKKGEIVPKELYNKYSALCEDCYGTSIKVKK